MTYVTTALHRAQTRKHPQEIGMEKKRLARFDFLKHFRSDESIVSRYPLEVIMPQSDR